MSHISEKPQIMENKVYVQSNGYYSMYTKHIFNIHLSFIYT